MKSARHEILNPVGAKTAGDEAGAAVRQKRGGKPVVGLLNNSKPNVSYFLETIERDIRAQGYQTVNATKPRSAGPYPDIESLAESCDYLINAVAD